MAISREAYQALEDIVGAENISEEPAVLDSYAFQMWAEFRQHGSKFMPRAGAVVLPGNTEEVQAIVKTCNQYKLKCKAHSTGWHMIAAPLVEDAVQLDMRRMDRILEIDEKNMFAVIEPYVIGATLQAEAMKVGLNTHMIGAGASCSPLAAATSLQGPGPDSIFMGTSPENLLAAEWVMPTGDILRTGSLGSGFGWFSGDGPGPSTRGIFKGILGAAGGLGVFTKVAIKLYPWPGLGLLKINGIVPVYTAQLPETVRIHTIAWSTWQDYATGVYKIFYNDIGYIAHRQFIMFGDELQAAVLKILTDKTKTLCDLEELLKNSELQRLTKEMRYSFQIVLAGMTPRDIEYQEKILDQILGETGGWKVAMMEESIMAKWSALYMIKLCFKSLNYYYSGGFWDAMARGGTPDLVTSGWMEEMRAQKRKYGKQGGIVDEGGDAGMGGVGSIGGGGYTGYENFTHYDPSDAESVEAALMCREEATHLAQKAGIGDSNPFFIENERMQQLLAERQSLSIYFQSKIKEAFDPNGVGDGSYLALEKIDKRIIW